tara:strand:+ start:124 stop:363 length:240 start_codon:yes stop_codon:yes gene_type:complete
MLLQELRHYMDKAENSNIEFEMRIRCEAAATVTAKLMSRIFKEEDGEEIRRLIEKAQESDFNTMLRHIDNMTEQMKLPN